MTSKATVITHTYNEYVPSAQAATFEVYAPRFLLAEINTHRLLSRSAQSSRAIPVLKRAEMVRNDPFIPLEFGKNKPGMSANEAIGDVESVAAESVWRGALMTMLVSAEELAGLGVHKQLANRLLEPFAHFYGVITATEWENFWTLRLSPEAQPEFKELAQAMQTALADSKPRSSMHSGNYHLPYCPDYGMDIDAALKVCSARCARVSYKTVEGKLSNTVDDIALCERLLKQWHLSPFDHPAKADTLVKKPYYTPRPPAMRKWYWENSEDQRQYYGFVPYRVQVEKELGVMCRRSSFAPIEDELVTHA